MKIEGSWAEFPPITYDTEHQNESRADYGSRISACTGDWEENDLQTDLTDALANVAHFIERCGFEVRDIFSRAITSWEGDAEDGPPARVQEHIRLAHDRHANGGI